MISIINEAVESGARKAIACDNAYVDIRTVQRWEKSPLIADKRKGPKICKHALSEEERSSILEICNTQDNRNLSAGQIVPKLADTGLYIASERTFYRVLAKENQNRKRGSSQGKANKKPEAIVANNPLEVWSWDITYLKTEIKGMYYYLYLVMDVYSRMIVGNEIREEQNTKISSEMMKRLCKEHQIDKNQLILHADNGGPMKGALMVSTLQKLGVIPSFNRPAVSCDNAYSESLFKTLKYRPSYPKNGFKNLNEAQQWVTNFISWYNFEHLHSEINFVTPYARHVGDDVKILENRKKVYQEAMKNNPCRWPGGRVRNWDKQLKVGLNNPNLRKNRQSVMVEAA